MKSRLRQSGTGPAAGGLVAEPAVNWRAPRAMSSIYRIEGVAPSTKISQSGRDWTAHEVRSAHGVVPTAVVVAIDRLLRLHDGRKIAQLLGREADAQQDATNILTRKSAVEGITLFIAGRAQPHANRVEARGNAPTNSSSTTPFSAKASRRSGRASSRSCHRRSSVMLRRSHTTSLPASRWSRITSSRWGLCRARIPRVGLTWCSTLGARAHPPRLLGAAWHCPYTRPRHGERRIGQG